jgi:DNA-binding beta-propeller fold protein YncE
MAGSASAATLLQTWGGGDSPKGIAVAHGHVYVADHGSHAKRGQVQVFTTDGHFVRAWDRGFNLNPCSITATHNRPVRVILGVCGGASRNLGGVFEFTEDGHEVAFTHSAYHLGYPFGPIEGVAVDGPDIYAADSYHGWVYKLHRSGHYLVGVDHDRFPWPTPNVEAFAIDPLGYRYFTEYRRWIRGPGGPWGGLGSMPGELNNPSGIAFDPQGNVYVADTGNNRIQEFTNRGTYLNQWTHPGPGTASFASPSDVGVDAHGHVYVADTGNNRIVKFAP